MEERSTCTHTRPGATALSTAKMSKKAKRLGAASAMSAKTWHRNQTEVNTVLQTLRRTSDEDEDESTKAQKISMALQRGRAARESKSVNVMSLVSAAAGAVFGSVQSASAGSGGGGGGGGGGELPIGYLSPLLFLLLFLSSSLPLLFSAL